MEATGGGGSLLATEAMAVINTVIQGQPQWRSQRWLQYSDDGGCHHNIGAASAAVTTMGYSIATMEAATII